MRYLSVCSGIEAATVAWHPLGWKPVGFSEIEKFPAAVLAHHYPDVPNFGDMTKYEEWPDDLAPDVLVGGTPCQSFSVAGLRKGLDDPRGNLMLTFGAIAAKYRPEWLVWENVPGVLSSNGGRDFGTFLGMLAELGYGFAYRVLDAQYFGVAQRRRRVFVVANARDWRRAAAVLFERHSLSGHPAPRREAGEGTAPTLDVRAGRSGETTFHTSGGLIPSLANTLTARMHKGINTTCDEGQTLIPMAADVAPTIPSRSKSGGGLGTDFDCDGGLIPVAFDTTQITSPGNYSSPRAGDPCHPLTSGGDAPAIAFGGQMSVPQVDIDLSQTLQAKNPQAVAVALRGREGGATAEVGDDCAFTLRASGGGGDKPHVMVGCDTYNGAVTGDVAATLGTQSGDGVSSGPSVLFGWNVRRITPVEAERLQGFPDGYTAIPWRGKPADKCPDGPRYKALGNSMAVPVMAWIGERISAVAGQASLEDAA